MGTKRLTFGDIPETTEAFFRERVGPPGHRRPSIRSSGCGTADLCPRRFLYDERLGIKGRSHQSALVRGDFYHQFRAAMLDGTPPDAASSQVRAVLESHKIKLLASASKAGLLPTGEDVRSAVDQAEQDYLVGQAMALAFWEMYPFDKERWGIHHYNGEPMVEFPFSVRLDWLKQPIEGVFDCVIHRRWSQEPEVWLVDDKTTSISPVKRAASASFSWQATLYRIGLSVLLGTHSPVGIVHNIVRVPTIRYCSKDSSFEAYVERVKQWYRDERAKRPDEPPILQSWTRFSGPLFTDGIRRRLEHYDRLCRQNPNVDVFYQNEKSCFAYNKLCPYLDLCTNDPSQWPGLIDAKYDIRFRTLSPQEDE